MTIEQETEGICFHILLSIKITITTTHASTNIVIPLLILQLYCHTPSSFFFEITTTIITIILLIIIRGTGTEIPPSAFPLFTAKASISSKKIMAGEAALAFLNTSRTALSDSPTHLLNN